MNVSWHSLPKVTVSLILFALWVAWSSRLGAYFTGLQPYFISWYVDSGLLEIRAGQVWRLITPIFIHFGIMHLIFNLMMIWQLGELLERYLGATRFGAMVLLLAICSNLAQFFTSGPVFGGLSGVVYGLFGYFWMASRFNPRFAYRINPSAVKMLLVWFVLCWFNFFGFLGDIQIANMAHSVGLLLGIFLGLVVAWMQMHHSP